MVSTAAAVLAPGVTVVGLKLQSESAGCPVQEKLTALVNDAPMGITMKL